MKIDGKAVQESLVRINQPFTLQKLIRQYNLLVYNRYDYKVDYWNKSEFLERLLSTNLINQYGYGSEKRKDGNVTVTYYITV